MSRSARECSVVETLVVGDSLARSYSGQFFTVQIESRSGPSAQYVVCVDTFWGIAFSVNGNAQWLPCTLFVFGKDCRLS